MQVSPMHVSKVINSRDWNQGPVRKKGIQLYPIQIGPIKVVVSNLGGNILSYEVNGTRGDIQAAHTFLDFTNDNDFKLQDLTGMMQIGGLTPPMSYPGVGRLTELADGSSVSPLKNLQGFRMLKEKDVDGATRDIGIHGAIHNRLWDVTNIGPVDDAHKIEVSFEVSGTKNHDLFSLFGSGSIKRTYDIKPVGNGAEIKVTTKIKGLRLFGDHTFLNTPERQNWTLKNKAGKLLAIDTNNYGVPTGEFITGVDAERFNNPAPLSGPFDGTFGDLDFSTSDSMSVAHLLDTDTGIELGVLQDSGLSFTTIFTPMGSNSVALPFACIEGQTVTADAFKLGKGESGKLFAPHGLRSEKEFVTVQKYTARFT